MRHTGFLIVDDRCSGGQLVEADTTLCRHCQCIMVVPSSGSAGAYCTKCGGPVCPDGPCAVICTPVARQVDEALRWAARAGLGLGPERRATIRQEAVGIRRRLERDAFRDSLGQERTP